jgi:hypothetical protein
MSYDYWTRGGRAEAAVAEAAYDAPAPHASSPMRARATRTAPVQVFAGVVGAVFLLVGILGFVPGVTSNFGDLGLLGRDSHAELLGLFQVSVLHNIVHLLFGVGLLAARNRASSVAFLIGGGVVYLAVWAYGSLIDLSGGLNFLPLNTTDNYLHLGLGIGMIALGAVGAATERSPAAA